MRFEIELACVKKEVAGQEDFFMEEVLNLSLYDQADPNTLYLCNIDKAKFLRMQQRQNLKIEQFSTFGCHFQSLLNHCIDQQDGEFVCALKNVSKQTGNDGDEPLLPGMQVQVFQGSCFRNLLHLELFFRRANDEEARAWISRKQIIAWGIINELSVEIERLEAINADQSDEIRSLKAILERTKIEHETILKQTTETLET